MADNRFNQVPGFVAGGGFQIGQQNATMNGVPNMTSYRPAAMPVSPMMQQQMMMASRMMFPGMQMGVPTSPPPPYGLHSPSPGYPNIPNRPRASLNKAKEGLQSEKERFFEEQRQKLRLFGKPGAMKVDADKLIGSMFAADVKTPQSKTKAKNSQKPQDDDDDGFGDFLQGPSVPGNTEQKDNQSAPETSQTVPEPKLECLTEKKDLKSMMLEYSDLSAPKKAKGFHKLTLNEVQKSAHGQHKASFHESDHSRSWKKNTEDLEGLFQLPVAPKQTAVPIATELQHPVYSPQQMMAVGLPPTNLVAFPSGSPVLVSPSGQPPSYNDVIGRVTSPTTGAASPSAVISHPGSGDLAHRPVRLPEWCSHREDQVPPVYKQVFEASLVGGKISTERLYPILLLSGIPREKLAQIWSLCNTATPGQLTRNELWTVLALIALTQNNYSTSSLDILARCPVAPVPAFAPMPDASAPATLPIIPQHHQSHSPHQSPATLTTSPIPAHIALPSGNSHQPAQPHKIQHSKLTSEKASLTPVTTGSKNTTSTEDDDDFADFQAAAPTINKATVSVGKGHTSPSFEDDDFTDGRDSLSQVSTSEQSENEDIRNFENYVEEYNQQKEKPNASPLHCPFPAIPQNQAAGATKRHTQAFGDSKHSGKDGRLSKVNISSIDPAARNSNRSVYAGSDQAGGAGSAVTNFKNNVSTFTITSPIPLGINSARNTDFADFKMASLQATTASDVPSSNELSLIGDEDKYSALRVLTLDGDLIQHSLFEEQGRVLNSSDNQEANVATNEEDWADFSAAPAVSDQLKQSPFLAATKETEANSGLKRSTGFLFGEDPSSASTPSKGLVDSTMSGDQLSFSSLSDPDSTVTDMGWAKNSMGSGSDWGDMNADSGGEGRYHRSDYTGPKGSANDSTVNKLSTSGVAISAGLSGKSYVSPSVRSDLDNVLKGRDNSGQLSQKISSFKSDQPFEKFSQNTTAKVNSKDLKDVSYSDAKANDDEEDWCDFSGAGAGGAAASGVGRDEVESGDNRGKFVTIKKQNLGTSEIMGLFKVRDDPATLSSYQLPPPQHASKSGSSHGQGGHRAGSLTLGHRRSSDFDDDLGPPPMDFGHDDDYDDHAFSRGYDLDDFIQCMPTVTTYSPFGVSHSIPLYSRAGGISKLKENKEDCGSVHSLDLPSAQATNPSSSDSVSVSSADMASGEIAVGGSGGVISAESKSLDSLDLRSENGDLDSSDGGHREGAQASGPTSHHQPIQPQELLDTMPDFADRYNIEREAQGSDRYGYEWDRCLSNCCRIISEANTLFNTVDSSSVCNEVLKSSQGSEYVTCVIEIYRVVCRVLTSMRFTAISTTELEQTLKNIDIAWNNLTAFLVATSLLPEQTSLVFTNCILKSDSEHAQNLACGLCLLSVDARPLTSSAQYGGTNSCKLVYAGRQYHATCANFWVNCVDQTLPSLTLPDLL